MEYSEICKKMTSENLSTAKRMRILLLARTRQDIAPRADDLADVLADFLQCDMDTVMKGLQKAEEQWRRKVFQLQSELLSLFVQKKIFLHVTKGWKGPVLPPAQIEQLYIVPASLILQQVSRSRCDNHLRTRDLRLLMFLLKNPAHLKKAAAKFESSLVAAARMQKSSADQYYLFYTLVFVQVCADYMSALLDTGLGAKTAAIRQSANMLHEKSAQELASFLSGTPC
jgi:hypothetical protein